MDLFIAILLRSMAILTLVSGLSGLLLSVLLLLTPQSVHRISAGLNRRVDLDAPLSRLNFPLRIDPLIYRFPFFFGICFCAGGLFCLVFLMFGVRAAVMSNVFGEIAVEFLLLLGKVSGLIGVVAGFFLIIAPQKFFRVQSGANLWVDTDKLIRRLDRTAIDIDAVCLRHPVFFGSIGIVASTTLLVLSVVNLLHRVPM